MSKHFTFLGVAVIGLISSLTSCSFEKEYDMDLEQLEISRGDIQGVKIRHKHSTIKAKNDEDASEKAYGSYVISMDISCNSEKEGSEYLWVPLSYTIKDNNGNYIPLNLNNIDDTVELVELREGDESIYYKLIGYYRYAKSPYGLRHPKE